MELPRTPIPLILSILLLSSIPTQMIIPTLMQGHCDGRKLTQSETALPAEHSISVPFHYQEKTYYCGPAALQMVFDYYGENVSQFEVADAARTVPDVTYGAELRRAAHFSNLSNSMGSELPETFTGYANRKLGYGAFARSNLGTEDLRSLISQDLPIILLMTWAFGQSYGHYRVAMGYNQTHIFMHDPWNKDDWGGDHGGPNVAMNFTFFDTMWDYSEHWGLMVSPWKPDPEIPDRIHAGEQFPVTVNVAYVHHAAFSDGDYVASSCTATVLLQNGLALAEGENTTKNLGDLQAGQVAQTEWTLTANHPGDYSIEVCTKGRISGTVPQRDDAHPAYDYQDEIGTGSSSFSITVGSSSPNGFNLLEVTIALIAITVAITLVTAWYHFRLRRERIDKRPPDNHASVFL